MGRVCGPLVGPSHRLCGQELQLSNLLLLDLHLLLHKHELILRHLNHRTLISRCRALGGLKLGHRALGELRLGQITVPLALVSQNLEVIVIVKRIASCLPLYHLCHWCHWCLVLGFLEVALHPPLLV